MFASILKRNVSNGMAKGANKFVMFAHEKTVEFKKNVEETLHSVESSREEYTNAGLEHYFLNLITPEIDNILLSAPEINQLLIPLVKSNPGCCGIRASLPYNLTAEESISSNLVKNLTRIALHLQKLIPSDHPLTMNLCLGIARSDVEEVNKANAAAHFAETLKNTTKICTDLFRDSLEYSVLFGVESFGYDDGLAKKRFEIIHDNIPKEAMMAYNLENALIYDPEDQVETQQRQYARFLFPKEYQVGNLLFGPSAIKSLLELQTDQPKKKLSIVNLRNHAFLFLTKFSIFTFSRATFFNASVDFINVRNFGGFWTINSDVTPQEASPFLTNVKELLTAAKFTPENDIRKFIERKDGKFGTLTSSKAKDDALLVALL